MDKVDLGTGELGWRADERRTDRYGTVHLDREADGHCFDFVCMENRVPSGTHGRLVAVVLDIRESAHLGDWARGLRPTTPAIGEEITLGVGTVFVERFRGGSTEVGVRPDDGRPCGWLDPAALYRCHNQTVRLELHTTPTEQR